MKNSLILIIDVTLRIAFTLFGVYLAWHYKTDTMVVIAGYTMIVFNLMTTFFDTNYHKHKAR